jgi:hypothetical protein
MLLVPHIQLSLHHHPLLLLSILIEVAGRIIETGRRPSWSSFLEF